MPRRPLKTPRIHCCQDSAAREAGAQPQPPATQACTLYALLYPRAAAEDPLLLKLYFFVSLDTDAELGTPDQQTMSSQTKRMETCTAAGAICMPPLPKPVGNTGREQCCAQLRMPTPMPTITTASCFSLAATEARSAAMSACGQQFSPPDIRAKLHMNKASTSGAGFHPSEQEQRSAHQTTAKTHR